MHVMGKWFIGLIVVACVPAAYLTIDLAKKQDDWMKQIVELKKKRDDNNLELAKARALKETVEGDVTRLMSQWGHQWDSPNSGPLQADAPEIRVTVGTTQGVAANEAAQNKPTSMYLFTDADKDASRYLGNFQVVVANPNETGLRLTREAYPGEIATWPTGVYRTRESIPYAWKQIFLELHTEQTIADQNEIDEKAKLTIQEQHVAESQKALDLRHAELNGDPAAKEQASEEVKLGLVDSIRRGEVERNKILKDVDTLRRAISDSYADLEAVLEENRKTVESSSAAATETASSGASAKR